MKKLVALSAVMFFVVLGFAATSGAAALPGNALGTIMGAITIRNFSYPCAGACVHILAANQTGVPFWDASLNANEVDTDPILGGPCVTANANGVYTYNNLEMPSLMPTTGTLRVSWVLSMFGVTLQFDNNGVDSFTFAYPMPGSTPTVNANIEVWPTAII